MLHKPRVLCVDDDPDVLDGLCHQLRRRYDVYTAVHGAIALRMLDDDEGFAVVMSDMRMPGMNGAQLLAEARQRRPHAVRILLTGQSDLDSAVAAVNEGQIFRFLQKPVKPHDLTSTIGQAVAHHGLLTAERELLSQTVRGCVEALVEVLSLAKPNLFGRATRLRALAQALAAQAGLEAAWQVELAAMLSQVGLITLPERLVDRAQRALPLNAEEQAQWQAAQRGNERVVGRIPRLQDVLQIMRAADADGGSSAARAHPGGMLLRLVMDFDSLQSRGCSAGDALATLQQRAGHYEGSHLEALATHIGNVGEGAEIRELPVEALRPGMVLAEDLLTAAGAVFASRGYTVTERFVTRARNFQRGTFRGRVRVTLPEGSSGDA